MNEIEVLLVTNLDKFTRAIKNNPSLMTDDLVNFFFETYGSKKISDFEYYYCLRILGLLLKNPQNINRFDVSFKDQQFMELAVKLNKDVTKYFNRLENFRYNNKGWTSKLLNCAMKYFDTMYALAK